MESFWDIFNPKSIIQAGGLVLLFVVVFAETGLFIGFFLPGDSLIFISGMICAVNPELVNDVGIVTMIGILSLAAVTGNIAGYWFGRSVGPALFKREDSLIFKKRNLEITKSFYEKHGGKTLILGRFLPVIRTFAPIIAGVIKVGFTTFMIYNIAGALAWISSLGLAGYYLGNINWVEENVEYIVIGLILVTTVPIYLAYRKEKKGKPGEA